ncbi:ankyrin repeat domain-containing protein 2B isoform X1 [Brassica rapa]|uniref:ankyrin repeat domain-containing protein 2B isoform X1 n=1 Tax=Brassica campestris TaxID=3711 RepID=UPI00142DB05B|nr:ankyrin repeat domain-containing protein 2B isoform X1 [Brassica rapa]
MRLLCSNIRWFCFFFSADSSKITSPALKFDALDFPAMKAMEDFETCAREHGEKMREDPAYILELSRCNPGAKFDQEQLSNMGQMFQRLQDHARQDPRASFENLGKPGALEEFAERVAQIRKDPEVEPILAELDACPAALLKFVDDKQVLKKLGKSMLRSQVKDLSVLSFRLALLLKAFNSLPFQQGLNYDDDDEELVSEGRKALKIAFGYAKMKCFKVLLDAERKKANKVERKKKTTSHHASRKGKTKRSNILSNKGDDVALKNSESQIPTTELDDSSSMC